MSDHTNSPNLVTGKIPMHVPGDYAFAKAHVEIKKETISKRRKQTGSNEQIMGKCGKQSSELGQEAIMETTIRIFFIPKYVFL